MILATRIFVVGRGHPYCQIRRSEPHKEAGDGASSQGRPCSSHLLYFPWSSLFCLPDFPSVRLGHTGLTCLFSITNVLPSSQPADS